MNRLYTGVGITITVIILTWCIYIYTNTAHAPFFELQNSSFTIDTDTVTLTNGIEQISIPNSASMITTRYFGNEATGDLNGDGLLDTAFLITRDSGGTGLFYYVVVALGAPRGHTFTNAFFVGDRIAPQSTEIHTDSRELHVNFAERARGEPMTTQPSVGATLLLKVTPTGKLEGLMK